MQADVEAWIDRCVARARERGDGCIDLTDRLFLPASTEEAINLFETIARKFPEWSGLRAHGWRDDSWCLALWRIASQQPNFTTLDLCNNKIGDEGVKHLTQLTQLTALDLTVNNIGAAGAKHLMQLTQLTSLNLGVNWIGDAGAKHLAQLTQLTSLNLGANNIGVEGAKHLPQLKQLTALNLCDNNIGDEGAKHLTQLTQLTSLDLYMNNIGEAGAKHLAQLTQLTALALYMNDIGDEGAKHLAQLTQLTALDLAANYIGVEGAKHLARLTQLTALTLHTNDIGDAGAKYLAQLKQLTALALSNNNIGAEGAKHLAQLTQLTALELDDNKIGDEGAKHLLQLPKLIKLDLHHANTTIPEEILNSVDARRIFEYLRGTFERPVGEVKVLFLGEGRTGKTTLSKRLFEKPQHFDAEEPSTHNVRHYRHRIELSAKDPSLTQIDLRIWDFGGQPELHSAHRFFLGRQLCFYVLVLHAGRDADGEDNHCNRLSYWLRTIAHHGGGESQQKAPVLIAITGCDAAADESHHRLREAIAQVQAKHAYFGAHVVGVIDGFGCPEAIKKESLRRARAQKDDTIAHKQFHEALSKYLLEVPDVTTKMNASFLKLKEWVEDQFTPRDGGTVKHFTIKNRAFREAAMGVSDGLLTSYLEILNSLGVAHWVGSYVAAQAEHNNDLLQRIYNPVWLKTPVYRLVRTPHDQVRDAILPFRQLEQNMKTACEGTDDRRDAELFDRDWDQGDSWIVLALMKTCRLAYPVPPDVDLLIPDLLKRAGEYARRHKAEWKESHVWRLEASYLPEKIFLRFLAEAYDDRAPDEELYRDEAVVCFQSVRVLLTPVYSPPNGQLPYVLLHIHKTQTSANADRIAGLVEDRFRVLYRSEYPSDRRVDDEEQPTVRRSRNAADMVVNLQRKEGLPSAGDEEKLAPGPGQFVFKPISRGNSNDCDWELFYNGKGGKYRIKSDTGMRYLRHLLRERPKKLKAIDLKGADEPETIRNRVRAELINDPTKWLNTTNAIQMAIKRALDKLRQEGERLGKEGKPLVDLANNLDHCRKRDLADGTYSYRFEPDLGWET